MNRIIIIFFMLMLIASTAHATAQYPDKIIFEGKKYNMQTNPREPY